MNYMDLTEEGKKELKDEVADVIAKVIQIYEDEGMCNFVTGKPITIS